MALIADNDSLPVEEKYPEPVMSKKAQKIAERIERLLPNCEVYKEGRSDRRALYHVSRTEDEDGDGGFESIPIHGDYLGEINMWLNMIENGLNHMRHLLQLDRWGFGALCLDVQIIAKPLPEDDNAGLWLQLGLKWRWSL
jgi:hypothetical protein